MVPLELSGEQQAIIDSVSGVLSQRGKRPAKLVLEELGISTLLDDG
ncbi:MAG: hypothetical protein ACI9TB_000614 [Parasphingorhabdus sp.]|jgi:hypothetical protein|nr:hypothetical protein [Parasphingorhabdus sp.]|tara:strand:- start:2414 stop:2551 length:138 start_codon:yes stop_codon:yes gene_type:complete